MSTSWSLFLIDWAALAVIATWLWIRQRRSGNAGWIDLMWSASIGVLGLQYAVLGEGWAPRRWLVGALVAGWSLRLSLHLLRRLRSESEDGRYARLRKEWGESFDATLFGFYQAQVVLVMLLVLPVMHLASMEQVGWRVTDALAVLLWSISIVGERAADRQLEAFRKDVNNRGRTCDRGLWRYSRHPNYFFEWLHWLVYPLLGIGSSGAWMLWLAPLGMWLLITRVTGVPPTEEQALRSRGDDYRAYQRRTNAFFPGPPRSAPAELLERS